MRKLATVVGVALLLFTAATQTANAAAQQPVAASPCTAVGSNLYNRTYACAKVHHSVPVIVGTKEGLVDAVTAHEIQLNVKSRTFTDKVSLEIHGYTGDANIRGLTLSLSVSCGGTCKASVAGLRGIAGEDRRGGPGHRHLLRQRYDAEQDEGQLLLRAESRVQWAWHPRNVT
ncbi:hypothetical protein [Streptomyces sp. LaBMicrA B280]|uniref:hypothetical protein n=1 Tax=Streptomyces sp. LaBMicrA B280 TaxID=3391001 RepID=UPI003BA5B27D